MTQPPLLVVLDSYADLPPKWDGQPVQWRDWSRSGVMFLCYRGRRKPPDPRCPCGGLGTQTALGLIDGTVALVAVRCAGCGIDQVVEVGEAGIGKVWNLEWPADYGPDGST